MDQEGNELMRLMGRLKYLHGGFPIEGYGHSLVRGGKICDFRQRHFGCMGCKRGVLDWNILSPCFRFTWWSAVLGGRRSRIWSIVSRSKIEGTLYLRDVFSTKAFEMQQIMAKM